MSLYFTDWPDEDHVCECYHSCAEDDPDRPDAALGGCSLSGEFHVHEGEPCPAHPDAKVTP